MKIDSKKIVLSVFIFGAFSGCSSLISDNMLKSVHQDMDKNNDGYIDYHEYINSNHTDMKEVKSEAKKKGMSIEEYQKWDFNRADSDRNGKVTPQELIDLARREL